MINHQWKTKLIEGMQLKIYTCERCGLKVEGTSQREIGLYWKDCKPTPKDEHVDIEANSDVTRPCKIVKESYIAQSFENRKHQVFTVCNRDGIEVLVPYISVRNGLYYLIMPKDTINYQDFYINKK